MPIKNAKGGKASGVVFSIAKWIQMSIKRKRPLRLRSRRIPSIIAHDTVRNSASPKAPSSNNAVPHPLMILLPCGLGNRTTRFSPKANALEFDSHDDSPNPVP